MPEGESPTLFTRSRRLSSRAPNSARSWRGFPSITRSVEEIEAQIAVGVLAIDKGALERQIDARVALCRIAGERLCGLLRAAPRAPLLAVAEQEVDGVVDGDAERRRRLRLAGTRRHRCAVRLGERAFDQRADGFTVVAGAEVGGDDHLVLETLAALQEVVEGERVHPFLALAGVCVRKTAV